MACAGEQGKGETPAHVVVVRVEKPVAVPTGCAEDDNLKYNESLVELSFQSMCKKLRHFTERSMRTAVAVLQRKESPQKWYSKRRITSSGKRSKSAT